MSILKSKRSDAAGEGPAAIPPLPVLDRDEFVARFQSSPGGQEVIAQMESERLEAITGLVERHGAAVEQQARCGAEEGEALVRLQEEASDAHTVWTRKRDAASRAAMECSQRDYGRELAVAAYARALEALAPPEIDQSINALEERFHASDEEPTLTGESRFSYPHAEGLRRAQSELRKLKYLAIGRKELAKRIASIKAGIPPLQRTTRAA